MQIIRVWWEIFQKYRLGIFIAIAGCLLINYIFGTVCLWKLLFGIPCPACGMTRAAFLLLTGRFWAAFQMHPMIYLFPVQFFLVPFLKRYSKNYSLSLRINVIMCLVIGICLYLYRMKLYFPTMEPMTYRNNNFLQRLMMLLQLLKR